MKTTGAVGMLLQVSYELNIKQPAGGKPETNRERERGCLHLSEDEGDDLFGFPVRGVDYMSDGCEGEVVMGTGGQR